MRDVWHISVHNPTRRATATTGSHKSDTAIGGVYGLSSAPMTMLGQNVSVVRLTVPTLCHPLKCFSTTHPGAMVTHPRITKMPTFPRRWPERLSQITWHCQSWFMPTSLRPDIPPPSFLEEFEVRGRPRCRIRAGTRTQGSRTIRESEAWMTAAAVVTATELPTILRCEYVSRSQGIWHFSTSSMPGRLRPDIRSQYSWHVSLFSGSTD